jgi:hypothetical protein
MTFDTSMGATFAGTTSLLAVMPPSPLLTGLVSYYTLNEQSGNRVDSVGFQNAIEVSGATGYGTGKSENAALFAGSNHLGADWSVQNPLPASFTIACWVYMSSAVAGNRAVISRYGASGLFRQFMLYTRPSSASFAWMVCAPAVNQFYAFGSLIYNSWLFVVGVYDKDGGGSYGTIASSFGAAGSVTHIGPLAINIGFPQSVANDYFRIGGAHDTNSPFVGLIDDVGVWSRALTTSEREQLYNSGAGKFYPFA